MGHLRPSGLSPGEVSTSPEAVIRYYAIFFGRKRARQLSYGKLHLADA